MLGWRRAYMRHAALGACLALLGSAVLSTARALDLQALQDSDSLANANPAHHLGVIVPVWKGDIQRAVASLDRWPARCSSVVAQNVDLVLYYAEGEEDSSTVMAAAETIAQGAGRCFAQTRTVYAHLEKEEDVYPKGPSVMFYKMFLDQDISSKLSEYDALAIIEWDVLVASDRSFEELYHATFRGPDEFWVKGSNLEGTNFHVTAEAPDMWHVLGHINGNAIYNNNDPAFVEYVAYTRARWEYTQPFDVALWLTISDFPYSWPLWQRFSNKFVTTNLISYVGFEHVDHKTVSDAVAGHTLFIHGSRVDEGNMASIEATKDEASSKPSAKPRRSDEAPKTFPKGSCKRACGSNDDSSLPAGTSTVCDDTCGGSDPRFDGFLCGAGDSRKFGAMCRLCYNDVAEAHRAQRAFAGASEADVRHVIMCDTMRPPEAAECTDKCASKKDTVCDDSCGSGRYGDYNCNWRDRGSTCRFCFNDIDAAIVADGVAKRRGGHVIMCSTFEPPVVVEKPDITFEEPKRIKRSRSKSRKLQKWKEGEKWKTETKWATNDDDDEEPKWKTNKKWQANDDDEDDAEPKWKTTEKWKENVCLDGCEDSDGATGRVCDESCNDGEPYGTLGCSAEDGLYGRYCRACYNDEDEAIANDSADDRAIMCSTVLPVENVYRRLSAPDTKSARRVARKLQKWKENEKWKTETKWATNDDDDEEPKWKTNKKWQANDDDEDDAEPKWKTTEKWKENVCLDGCDDVSSDGMTGRVCDESCNDGEPYGTLGCSAEDGTFGRYCRTCYYDEDEALANDSADDRAIMCSTVLPVENVYRRLSAPDTKSARRVARKLRGLASTQDTRVTASPRNSGRKQQVAVKPSPASPAVSVPEDDIADFFSESNKLPFTKDLERGNLCAFVAASADEVREWEVTVKSILQFVPGMRVAIAVEASGLDAYERAVGNYPGVEIYSTPNPFTASLLADKFCGPKTSLIFYVKRGSVVSRTFTSKDTHSTNGDLLVVYSNPRVSYHDSMIASETISVLGFAAPSFTFETDLILPVGANADLRAFLVAGLDDMDGGEDQAALAAVERLGDFEDITAVPQELAALAYSRNTPGVWFLDPQAWVTQHLFKTASIWNIPLVKPRFTCGLDLNLVESNIPDTDIASALQSNLDFFARGGTCDNGLVDLLPEE